MHELTDDQVKAWCADNGIQLFNAPLLSQAIDAHVEGQMHLPWPETIPETEFKSRFGDFLGSDVGKYLTAREQQLHQLVDEIYQERLKLGVAREKARKDLPLSNYTEAYWKVNLHNLMHFLRLRLDSHAQKEIRDFGQAIANIVQEWVPQVWEAFVDYRLEGVTLSRMELEAVRRIVRGDLGIDSAFSLPQSVDKEYTEWTHVATDCFNNNILARPLTIQNLERKDRVEFFEECGLDNVRERKELWQKLIS